MTYIYRQALFAGVFLATWALAGCAHLTANDACAALDDALAKTVVDGEVRNAVMWVDAPRQGIAHGSAVGIADATTGAPMTIDTPFLSASVGKLFIAAAILQMVREGALALDDSMTKFIAPEVVNGLPVVGGDGALVDVSIRMLLAHRSGLPDYFSGSSRDGAPNVFALLKRERERTWTRDEMLDYTRAHFAPVGVPGHTFHYADTNYDLLGLVLESVDQMPFHEVVRARVLQPLGLNHTWYHAFESRPDDVLPYADVFIDDVNLRDAPALSADQAGGGLATTVSDLRRFMRGLVTGNPVPLDDFEEAYTENAMHAGIDVGLSVWRIRPSGVFFALAGLPTLVGHSGATGVWAYYDRAHDAVLVGAVSQSSWQERHIEFLLSDVLPVLARTSDVDVARP